MTTRIRGIPVEVPLGTDNGLPKTSVVNLDSLVTIPTARLNRRIASLGPGKLRAAEETLRSALGMD